MESSQLWPTCGSSWKLATIITSLDIWKYSQSNIITKTSSRFNFLGILKFILFDMTITAVQTVYIITKPTVSYRTVAFSFVWQSLVLLLCSWNNTMKYGTFRYDTVNVENGLETSLGSVLRTSCTKKFAITWLFTWPLHHSLRKPAVISEMNDFFSHLSMFQLGLRFPNVLNSVPGGSR